jgi:hypothetical protein
MKFLALCLLLIALLVITSFVFAQDAIPSGTVLPVQLNSSLDSRKTESGKTITARLMQDVPLPKGTRIRAGAKIVGHVENVQPAASGQPAEITIQFVSLKSGKQLIPITTHLRAMASLLEVEGAQTPTTGPDRGTPGAWITRNLIGGEVAYGNGGPVARGIDIVGEAVMDGVLVPVAANPRAGCRGEISPNAQPQALWVFSSDACGAYGFPDVSIGHAGRTAPYGLIRLNSFRNFVVRSGAGVLLRVN